MTRDELEELHYITHVENLISILATGILSHRRAARLPHRSVAMQEIQDRRKKVVVPGARPLHDYVNLYINARNKMMFKIVCNSDIKDLCVLRISPDVLDLPNVVIADMNASSDYVKFSPSPKGLENIDKDLVYATSWNHPGPIAKMRHGAIVCAEVLVPDQVGVEYITGIYVANEDTRHQVSDMELGLSVVIKSNLFFK